MFNIWGVFPPIATDGVWGNATRGAILDIQHNTGGPALTADGIAGPLTQHRLCQVSGATTGPATDFGCPLN